MLFGLLICETRLKKAICQADRVNPIWRGLRPHGLRWKAGNSKSSLLDPPNQGPSGLRESSKPGTAIATLSASCFVDPGCLRRCEGRLLWHSLPFLPPFQECTLMLAFSLRSCAEVTFNGVGELP